MSLYELFISFRYLKSKKSERFISFNTVLSVLIIFLGVFTLIVVISVMNGFQSQIKDKILDVDAHITVTGFYGSKGPQGITDYQKLTKTILSNPEVVSAVPYFQGQGLLRYRGDILPVFVRGEGDTNGIPNDVKKFITEAVDPKRSPALESDKTFSNEPEVFIGSEMAISNMISIGDYVEIIVPKGSFKVSEGMTPGIGRFKVKGFFKTGYYDFDTRMVVMSLPQSQKLFETGDRVWGIGVKIRDIYAMNRVSNRIQGMIGFSYQSITAEQRNQNLFYALRLEKLIMMIILFLVVVAAGFTIMGTMVMVVMEKRKAIGVLKSMGAKRESIMSIFIFEGFLIGVTGTLLGVIFGLATSLNLKGIISFAENLINGVGAFIFKTLIHGSWEYVRLIPDKVYYIDGIPTQIQPEFVVFISVLAVFIATVSAVFPAWSASRLKPVETIRYE
ncbi:MAG TPA: ABC transporter permease [Spirochaetota bacterium]